MTVPAGFPPRAKRRPVVLRLSLWLFAALTWTIAAACVAGAAPLSVEEVRAAIDDATADDPPRLSGQDLSGLDLSEMDFRKADLRGANLFGTKLVGANLSGANLSGAILDAAWIMRADFTGANLSKASLFGPVVYSGLQTTPREAPKFTGADLSGARIVARLSRVDMRGCNLSGAQMGVDMKNQPMGQMRVDLSGTDLSGANLANADVNRAVITFARLAGANLSGANLFRADLTGSDLTGAELTGADLTDADVYDMVVTGVGGLDRVIGLDRARNRDKMRR